MQEEEIFRRIVTNVLRETGADNHKKQEMDAKNEKRSPWKLKM